MRSFFKMNCDRDEAKIEIMFDDVTFKDVERTIFLYQWLILYMVTEAEHQWFLSTGCIDSNL